jgi:hypothetical protein
MKTTKKTEQKEFINTVTLNKKGDDYLFVVKFDGAEFSLNLQKRTSKVGTTYIGGNEGENSAYIFKNESESPNAPQLKGKTVLDSKEYKFALWNRKGTSKNGKPYDFFSGAIEQVTTGQELNDDLPF